MVSTNNALRQSTNNIYRTYSHINDVALIDALHHRVQLPYFTSYWQLNCVLEEPRWKQQEFVEIQLESTKSNVLRVASSIYIKYIYDA